MCSRSCKRTCEAVPAHLTLDTCRERSDGLYQVFTYLIAKLVEELTIALAVSLVFSTVVWFAIGLQGHWILFMLVHYVTTCIGVSESLAHVVCDWAAAKICKSCWSAMPRMHSHQDAAESVSLPGAAS